MAETLDQSPKLGRSDLLHTERNASAALVEDTYDYIKENPLKSGAAAAGLLAGAYAVMRFGGSFIKNAELEKSVEQAGNGLAKLEFRAGQGVLKTREGLPIPDLERPFLSDSALHLGNLTEKARESYAGDLVKLWTMPRTAVGQAGENAETFAERMLKERAALTRENITPDSVAKELQKIIDLNGGGLAAKVEVAGSELAIANDNTFIKAAEEMQFKHVPQIGQFLKGTGRISEEQIESALQIQRGLPKDGPRKLLGEILVENKLAAQSDVDLAFANQQEVKAALRSVREKFLSNVKIEK